LHVAIPGNAMATVYVPAKNMKSITEGNRSVHSVKEIKFLSFQDKYAVYQLGSGTYHFKSDWQE